MTPIELSSQRPARPARTELPWQNNETAKVADRYCDVARALARELPVGEYRLRDHIIRSSFQVLKNLGVVAVDRSRGQPQAQLRRALRALNDASLWVWQCVKHELGPATSRATAWQLLQELANITRAMLVVPARVANPDNDGRVRHLNPAAGGPSERHTCGPAESQDHHPLPNASDGGEEAHSDTVRSPVAYGDSLPCGGSASGEVSRVATSTPPTARDARMHPHLGPHTELAGALEWWPQPFGGPSCAPPRDGPRCPT